MPYRTFIRLVNYKYLVCIIFLCVSNAYAEELVISKYKYDLYKGNIYFGVSEQTLLKMNLLINSILRVTLLGYLSLKRC